jgi:hypothetical protein
MTGTIILFPRLWGKESMRWSAYITGLNGIISHPVHNSTQLWRTAGSQGVKQEPNNMFGMLFYFLPGNRKLLPFIECLYVANVYDFKIYLFFYYLYLRCAHDL